MRAYRSRCSRRQPASLGCRPKAGPAEPALQGAFRGDIVAAMFVEEEHADQPGSPGRMLSAHSQGLLPQRVPVGRLREPEMRVGRSDAIDAMKLKAPNEVANGAWAKVEVLGQLRDALTLLPAPQQSRADGNGDWRRHGLVSLTKSVRPHRTAPSERGKTGVAFDGTTGVGINGKTPCRVTSSTPRRPAQRRGVEDSAPATPNRPDSDALVAQSSIVGN